MNGRTALRVAAAVALVLVAGFLVVGAYNAGLATGAAETAGAGATVPYRAWGYGWHPLGFGIGLFGLLGTLLFVFVIFGLVRAVFWGGRGRRWDGPAGGGRWEGRAHDAFDDWHRRAHEDTRDDRARESRPPSGNP
jgi:hypothetical protein